jgi:hypothetical protein
MQVSSRATNFRLREKPKLPGVKTEKPREFRIFKSVGMANAIGLARGSTFTLLERSGSFGVHQMFISQASVGAWPVTSLYEYRLTFRISETSQKKRLSGLPSSRTYSVIT